MIDRANLVNKLKEKWKQLSPEDKRKFIIVLIILIVVLISYLGYVSTRSKKRTQAVTQSNVTSIELQRDLVERSYYTEAQKKYEELMKEIEELKMQQEELKKEKEALEKEAKSLKPVSPSLPAPPPPPPFSSTASTSLPSVPEGTGTTPSVPPPPPSPKIEYVGDILQVKGKPEEGSVEQKQEEREDVKKKYYLPPSFMEATLLSGLDAPAVTKGEGHPVPCLFRVKAPAVLPNQVKANLKGCFIIGEGLGNLASERADIRLVSLSCIDKKGRAVIDQQIKGFVVDNDGKIGLRGRVISKAGGVIARAMLAGFISGIGNTFAYHGYTYTYSPEGSLIVPKPEYLLKGGLGQGIAQAASEIQKFFMELARQTIPVVEVLPTRTVTLVVSQGSWLELKDLE